jgi:hypothetical protein
MVLNFCWQITIYIIHVLVYQAKLKIVGIFEDFAILRIECLVKISYNEDDVT